MADESNIQVRDKEELTNEEGTREGPYFKPAVDIWETEDALTVQADVPGARPEDFDIDLRESVLTIQASTNGVEERWNRVYEEYRTGNFMRQFRLGQNIDQDKISANIENGVLTLSLPKAERAKPRKIEVMTG
jgi:HSP20 family protein